jgi:hypothetical protein
MTVQDEDLRALLGIDPERLQDGPRRHRRARRPAGRPPRRGRGAPRDGRLFKQVKERRRRERRDAQLAPRRRGHRGDRHGRLRAASTTRPAACRSPPETAAPLAGRLQRARACYQCKQRYVDVDAFYHQLCPTCAALNRSRATPAPT